MNTYILGNRRSGEQYDYKNPRNILKEKQDLLNKSWIAVRVSGITQQVCVSKPGYGGYIPVYKNTNYPVNGLPTAPSSRCRYC